MTFSAPISSIFLLIGASLCCRTLVNFNNATELSLFFSFQGCTVSNWKRTNIFPNVVVAIFSFFDTGNLDRNFKDTRGHRVDEHLFFEGTRLFFFEGKLKKKKNLKFENFSTFSNLFANFFFV